MIEATTSKRSVPLSTEAHIIQAAQKDPAAFEPLYRKYYPRIFRFILNRTGNREVTADLTSMVFLKALKSLPSYEPRGIPISSWLFRIAFNTTAAHFRQGKHTRYVILDERMMGELAGEYGSPEQGEESTYDMIRKVFEELKAHEIELIEMRFFEKMSFRTIGQILDITENNAKVRVYRILDRIKNKLTQ